MLGLVVVIAMLLVNGCDMAQAPANAQRSVVEIVQLPGMSKRQIMNKVNLWVAERAVNYQGVVQYKTANTIVVKANMQFPCDGIECIAKEKWRLWFMLKVDVKPSKMRVSISNLEVSWLPYADSLGYHQGYRGIIRLEGDLRNAIAAATQVKDSLISYVKHSKNSDW